MTVPASPFTRYWKPGCRVTASDVRVSNIDGNGLRIAFRVLRTMNKSPDSAEVAIYNLSPERRKALVSSFVQQGKGKLELESGYDGTLLHLFRGDLRRVVDSTMIEGADVPTVFSADDTGDALAEVKITLSTLGLTVAQMVLVALEAFRRAGEQITEHPSVQAAINTASTDARASLWSQVAIGTAAQLLDEAARTVGARWFVRNGQLYFARRGIPIDSTAVVIPRSHWLSLPSEDTAGALRLSTLLDPTILPGRQIVLRDRTAPGSEDVLRAEVCEYSGDTDSGSPWRVNVIARKASI